MKNKYTVCALKNDPSQRVICRADDTWSSHVVLHTTHSFSAAIAWSAENPTAGAKA